MSDAADPWKLAALTTTEREVIAALLRIRSATDIARPLGVAPFTLDKAMRGIPVRRASIARIRCGLKWLAVRSVVHVVSGVQ